MKFLIVITILAVLCVCASSTAADNKGHYTAGCEALSDGEVYVAVSELEAALSESPSDNAIKDKLIEALTKKADRLVIEQAAIIEAARIGVKADKLENVIRWAILSKVTIDRKGKPDAVAVNKAVVAVAEHNGWLNSQASSPASSARAGSSNLSNNSAEYKASAKRALEAVEAYISAIKSGITLSDYLRRRTDTQIEVDKFFNQFGKSDNIAQQLGDCMKIFDLGKEYWEAYKELVEIGLTWTDRAITPDEKAGEQFLKDAQDGKAKTVPVSTQLGAVVIAVQSKVAQVRAALQP